MNDPVTERFEEHRAHLLGLAYRMLGEMAAAEDIVQETWLRWHGANHADIRDARAWLSTVAIRLSLDALRQARVRRETYVGPWLPEPILPDDTRAFTADAPDAHAELASDLSLALLHVLERLSPEERAAFILHDAFDCEYRDIAATLGKSEVAARKLVSRARERVRHEHPRHDVSREQHQNFLARFAQASAARDADALGRLLAPDIVFYTDGGGRVAAALNPIRGTDKVQRLTLGLMRKSFGDGVPAMTAMEINGKPGLVITLDGQIHSALDIETDGERITQIYLVRNPDKLARLERALTKPSVSGSSASA
jgi:RNA polymerase sigma-70 factor (ECF subfamily)